MSAARCATGRETLIALDERFEGGAGHRVLGRLHSEAPKVPFFTGWVDHDKAIAELDKALAIAPAELSNRYYLADALLAASARRRRRARWRCCARWPPPSRVPTSVRSRTRRSSAEAARRLAAP